jgi:hypothetical protein
VSHHRQTVPVYRQFSSNGAHRSPSVSTGLASRVCAKLYKHAATGPHVSLAISHTVLIKMVRFLNVLSTGYEARGMQGIYINQAYTSAVRKATNN